MQIYDQVASWHALCIIWLTGDVASMTGDETMAHARVYADRMDYLADRMIRGRGNAAVLRAEWNKAWALWVRAIFGIAL